jgi:hypothetical protein
MRSTVALYYFFVFALHRHRKRDLYTYNMKERTKRTDNKFAGRARERPGKKNTLRADLIRSFLRIKRCCRCVCVCINWQNKKKRLCVRHCAVMTYNSNVILMGKCISRCRLLPFLNYMRSFLLLLRRLSFAPPRTGHLIFCEELFSNLSNWCLMLPPLGSSMEMSRFYLDCNYTRTIDTAN